MSHTLRNIALSLLFLASLATLPSRAAAQQAPRGGAPVAAPAPPTRSPGFVLRMSVGPQLGSLILNRAAGDILLFHGRVGLFVGHDLAAGYDGMPIALSVGYLGSVSVNHLEVVHRHGIALAVRVGRFLATVGGGGTFAHAYLGPMAAGTHVLVQPGFQFGNFTMTFPFEVDLYPLRGGLAPGLTFGISFGGATD